MSFNFGQSTRSYGRARELEGVDSTYRRLYNELEQTGEGGKRLLSADLVISGESNR